MNDLLMYSVLIILITLVLIIFISFRRFEIVADTDLDVPLVSQSLDHCHSMLLTMINQCLGSEVVNTRGRGADFFGLSHPTIHHLIQSSPGVRKCHGYVWTKFEVMWKIFFIIFLYIIEIGIYPYSETQYRGIMYNVSVCQL